MKEELLSDCCGVPPEGDGCEEAGICPCCHEHCEFVGEELPSITMERGIKISLFPPTGEPPYESIGITLISSEEG